MRPILPLRFESIQTLHETPNSLTFLATDHLLSRNNVVIKAYRKGHFGQGANLADTFAWYRGLRHPHIAGILNAGLTPKGDLFYVRDFAPATELFNTRDMELLKILLGAIDFLHCMGRVHGAIKPSNILEVPKSIQLADPHIGQTGRGAPSEEEVRFSAPELLRGGVRTIESDLYSVGALLYRFYSGRDLFDEADLESLRARHVWASPRPLTSISYVSRPMADIVEGLIHKDPAQRQPAFEALKNELRVHPVAALRSPAFGMAEVVAQVEKLHKGNNERLRIVVVEAPAGFGKTRCIEELQQRIALLGTNLAFSVCPTLGQAPEVTLAQWFLSVFEGHRSSVEDPSVKRLRELVDDATNLQMEYGSERIVNDLVDLLALITQKVALTLVVEDVDRTNRKLLRLIDSIVSRAGRLHLCLVITSRMGGIGSRDLQTFANYANGGLHHISLSHLGTADCDAIASFLELDPERRSAARKASGGNPFYLEEYCRNQKPGIPALVRKAMVKSLSALSKETNPVAETLSVFEEPVTLEVLHQVAGIGIADLEKQLAALRGLGLCDDRIVICHHDTRNLLYSRIPKKRKTALHALCYEQLKNSETDREVLAHHAYNGALFQIASGLYLKLGRDATQSREFILSARMFRFVELCRRRSPAVAPALLDETIAIAKFHGYRGDYGAAKKLLNPLLSQEAVLADRELLASLYTALSSPFVEPSSSERVKLLRQAVEYSTAGSPMFLKRSRLLVDALIVIGRLDEAEHMLVSETDPTDDVGQAEIAALRTTLLAARGRFGDAVKTIRGWKTRGLVSGAVKTNVGFYLEQQGEIREAAKVQREALLETKSSVFEPVCLRNLGSIETKLGNLTLAQNFFDRATTRLQEMKRAGRSPFNANACHSDAALHWIERGNYKNALLCIGRSHSAVDSSNQWEMFQFYSPQCELFLALGERKLAAEKLAKAKEIVSIGGFLDIERLLIEYRLQSPSEEVFNQIKTAIGSSREMGTAYQECRLLLALSENLLRRGILLQAKVAATEALELAQRKSFRILGAYAYLRRGVATENDREKQSDLTHCLQEASVMDLMPLASECAFHFGAWRYSFRDYSSARDYFFKSVSVAARMAESLDSERRKKFLLLPLHQDARRLLQDSTTRTQEFVSFLKEPVGRENLLVGGLYRLTSSLASASDPASIVQLLARSIGQSLSRQGVVILEQGKELTLQPLAQEMSEETRLGAIDACKRGSDKFCFFGLAKKQGRGSAAWIPIPSRSLKSGIYIECEANFALDEQEIQYLTISASVASAALNKCISRPSPSVSLPPPFSGIVGVSKSTMRLQDDIEVASRNSATVLIEGESGTGKELVAKAIHSRGSRATAPFVPIDCGALPDGLIESELFGTRKGSFTGADKDRRGLFEEADGGTIFLDEVANASALLQTKLLRVLQEREIRRLGEGRGIRVDVRLIAATNRNLEQLVKEGGFRQDLLFRLKVLYIQLPPLRERREEIPLLARTFLDRLNAANGTRKTFGIEALSRLSQHSFPGNVRELQNTVERAFYRNHDESVIDTILEGEISHGDSTGESQKWFEELTSGQQSFWSGVRDPYKRREIPRDRVLALVDLGLRATKGHYKAVASIFNVKDAEYGRFMDFLRRSGCLLDFRPYRKVETKY